MLAHCCIDSTAGTCATLHNCWHSDCSYDALLQCSALTVCWLLLCLHALPLAQARRQGPYKHQQPDDINSTAPAA
jgi:hypothetical protein